MIKKFVTAVIIIAGTTGMCFSKPAAKSVIKTPVSTFNKENLKMIKNNQLTNDFLKLLTYSQSENAAVNTADAVDYAKKYAEANEKFSQGNITSAYKDYKLILQNSANDDFVNLGFAYKFANIGLFTLAQEAINNIQDRETYNHQIQLMKSKLFPMVVLSYDNEIKLAQNYTEIYYNNLAFEVARELNRLPDSLKRADYAHYILSQAYYNTKEYNKAINEINRAISINPDNINYQKYKAQIFCETNRLSDSLKIMEELLSQDINVLDYKKDLEGLYYYTLAKATKDRELSKFYLAQYFLKTGDSARAVKELNQNLSSNPKDYRSLTLLAQIYFKQNNLADSMDMFEKSYKIKKNYAPTLTGIADMYLFKKDYKNALDYYIKAFKKDKKNYEAMVKAALCLKMTGMTDKSVELMTKVFDKNNTDAKIYYLASKVDDIKNTQYLKKAVSLDPLMTDAWLALADMAIQNNRLELARTYLKPVKYVDTQNSRYYYYQGLINKKLGHIDEAKKDFKKALEINPLDEDANLEMRSQL